MTPNRVGETHPMLRAVRGRRTWPRGARRTPNRWRSWAGERTGGRTRLDRAHRAARMAFLQPRRSPATVLTHPRPAYSSPTRPRLAINAVLISHLPGTHRTGGRQPAGPTAFVHRWHAYSSPTRPRQAINAVLISHLPGTHRTGGWQPAGPTAFVHRWHALPSIERSPHAPWRDRRPMAFNRRTAAAPALRSGSRPAPAGPPLWWVRTAHRGTAPGQTPGTDIAVRRVISELVTRVVRGHRRVELPAPGAGPIRERPRAAAPVEHAPTTGRPWTAGTQPAPTPANPHGGAGAAPVDVERLTDQIVTRLNDRLTAHRERFGRAF